MNRKEKTYRIGQKFKIDAPVYKNIYLLAQIDYNKISLINLVTGNRWANPFKVKDSTEISHGELQKLIGSKHPFVKVSEGRQK